MGTLQDIPTSFRQAQKMLGNRDERKVCYNTKLIRYHDHIALRHYATDVVRYYSDSKMKLRNGGYYTVSTKDRLNMALRDTRYRVYGSNMYANWQVYADGQRVMDFPALLHTEQRAW